MKKSILAVCMLIAFGTVLVVMGWELDRVGIILILQAVGMALLALEKSIRKQKRRKARAAFSTPAFDLNTPEMQKMIANSEGVRRAARNYRTVQDLISNGHVVAAQQFVLSL